MTPRVTLCREGLRAGDRTVPLRAGSVHYWRLDPRDWRRALEATRAMGLYLVDTYVPWGVHEVGPGDFDFGERDPRLDVAAFLRIAHEVGLFAIVRPGPHVNAELTFFGLPERVVWNPDCQARSPKGNPVMLPMVPVAFPVPSYASEAFHAEVRGWYRAVAEALAPLRFPDGPVALVQIDNEGSFYFRDGAYDQDYRPEAVALFRAFVRARYGDSPARLRDAWGSAEAAFDAVEPPVRFDATSAGELARHLDWAEFHEQLLATALGRMARELEAAGLCGLPTMHNFPVGQEATPLDAARIAPGAVSLCGLDYYHRASPREHDVIRRRTTELSARCGAAERPAFACEMGAGFPPFFAPIDERDSLFTLLTALAYGLRGYNLYMAVERDRWIGAPLDARGRKRPFADAFARLARALDELDFHALTRKTAVALVTPQSQRRLARVMHAFGPATLALFAMLGKGAREGVLEDDLGLGAKVALEADELLDAFEQALSARGVPFAHIDGDDPSFASARWIVCASNGGLSPDLVARLADRARDGALVTLGPTSPERDAAMRPCAHALSPFELLTGKDPSSIDAAVARAVERLALPVLATDPDGVFATVHEDAAGRPRCLFVGNPTERDLVARVSLRVTSASDLLEEAPPTVGNGFVELRLAPRTVRLLSISG